MIQRQRHEVYRFQEELDQYLRIANVSDSPAELPVGQTKTAEKKAQAKKPSLKQRQNEDRECVEMEDEYDHSLETSQHKKRKPERYRKESETFQLVIQKSAHQRGETDTQSEAGELNQFELQSKSEPNITRVNSRVIQPANVGQDLEFFCL